MANSWAHHDQIYYFLGVSVSANSHFINQNMYEKRIQNLGLSNELALVRPSGHSWRSLLID